MQSFRDQFYEVFQALPLIGGSNLAGGTNALPPPPPPGTEIDSTQSGKDNQPQPSLDRTQKFLFYWVILIIFLLLITALVVFGSYYLTSSYKFGIGVCTFVWALFFGTCVLFFLPPKLITTFFGGLAGIGINELGASPGLITKANKALTDIANQIGVIISGSEQPTDPFIRGMVWLFFGILCVTCLPAFFRDK